MNVAALDVEHEACVEALQQLATTRSLAALGEVVRAYENSYEAHSAHEEELLDTHLWRDAAAAAQQGSDGGGGVTSAGGFFDKRASMRRSHYADHARMLRELAPPQYIEMANSPEGFAMRHDKVLPRSVVERALLDFEAHANRYDSYGDDLAAALRCAGGEMPTAALLHAGGGEAAPVEGVA